MRLLIMSLLCLFLLLEVAAAQLKPETVGKSTLPDPEDSWFMITTWYEGSYIFDGDTGEMQGLISHNFYTPAVEINLSRNEAYLVESWYSRGVRGTREDVLTVVDMKDLSTKTEIDIPNKASALKLKNHIGLLGDQRHIVIFNMTPAQSVSIVDVVDGEFAGEISTPGCAVIMPSGERGFMMICGDGSLQYIGLDPDGSETSRERSKPFFVVDEDPVFDKPMKLGAGWLLISHEGLAYPIDMNKNRFNISDSWSLLSDEDKEEKWRPGGAQPFSVHHGSNLLYVLMHQGEVDTHSENGTEVWVYDIERRKRTGKMTLENEVSHILSSQEENPRLYVIDEEMKLQIYDGHTFRHLRTIEEPGPHPGLLQTLARHD
jgi:methylamine dehydrogenase heavy chain